MDVHDSKHYLELIDFIKTARAKGVADGQIQKSLTDVGWTTHDIATGFSFIDQDAISLIHSGGPEATSHPLLFYHFGRWIIAGVVLFFILFLGLFYGRSFFQTFSTYFGQWKNGEPLSGVSYDVPTQTTSTVITTLLSDEEVSRFEFTPAGTKSFYLETSRGRTVGTLPEIVSSPASAYSGITLASSGVKTGFAVNGVPFGGYFDYVQLPVIPPPPTPAFSPHDLSSIPYIASDNGVFFIVDGTGHGPSYDAILKLWISHDGVHRAYSALKNCSIHAKTVIEKFQKLSTKNCTLVLVVDGVERPIEKIPALGAFSPTDGSFAYVDADPACVSMYERGSDAGFSCSTQVVTATGAKSAVFDFVRSFGFRTDGVLAYSARIGNKEAVFVGGKSQGEFDAINPYQLLYPRSFPAGIFSPDGRFTLYAVRSGVQEALFFGTTQLPLYSRILAVSYSGATRTVCYAAITDERNVVINTVRF